MFSTIFLGFLFILLVETVATKFLGGHGGHHGHSHGYSHENQQTYGTNNGHNHGYNYNESNGNGHMGNGKMIEVKVCFAQRNNNKD